MHLFQWTPQYQKRFEILQHALISTHALASPDFSKGFNIETDASTKGIGVVLMQNNHPIPKQVLGT